MASMQPHKQSGAAAVEFAMIAVLLITLIVAIAGFGFLFWMQQRLSQQAGDVARTMMRAQMMGTKWETASKSACDQAKAKFSGDGTLGCAVNTAACGWAAASSLAPTPVCANINLSFDAYNWAPISGLRMFGNFIPAFSNAQAWQLSGRALVQVQ